MSESSALEHLLHHAAFAPALGLGWLRVLGADRTRWLNGMTTNNIAALQPGEGAYTFFLTAQGRIQADAYAFVPDAGDAQPESILLQTADPNSLASLLDRFIIMDEVELAAGRAHASRCVGLSLVGPQAAELLVGLGLAVPAALHLRTQTFDGEPVTLLATHAPLVPAFELWSDPATIGLVTESLRHARVTEATPEALTQLRLLSGIPLFGTDIRDRDLPQETSQTRALHFAKGCYLGQEIVERIHSRGNVHRTFSGFELTGEVPLTGAILSANGKPVGELTSAARVGPRILALGTVRREALDTRAALTFPGGVAVAHTLPFEPEI